VAAEATDTARSIVVLREEHRALVTGNLGRATGRALTVLEGLYFRPIVNVNTVAQMASLSFARANALVGELERLGLASGNDRSPAQPSLFV